MGEAPERGAVRWLISVPVWGARYVSVFEVMAAPALFAAVDHLGASVKFIIHTDAPERISAIFQGRCVDIRTVGQEPTYVALQEAHADAVRFAEPGDRVVLLNADLVVSGNLLTRCDEHFAAGKQAVVLLGIRTAEGLERPPVGASSRALLMWAWAHRHQIIRDLEWPHGTSMLPTNLFFTDGASVVARGFHLHPAAIVKHAEIKFHSTIDGDLLDYFPREAIHVVTSPDDCSMLEVSPPERRFPVRHDGTGFRPTRIAASMSSRASVLHKWLVTHPIVVVGLPRDCGDAGIIEEILKIMERSVPAEHIRGIPEGGRGRRIRRGYDPANILAAKLAAERAAKVAAERASLAATGTPAVDHMPAIKEPIEDPPARSPGRIKGMIPVGPRGQPR